MDKKLYEEASLKVIEISCDAVTTASTGDCNPDTACITYSIGEWD